MEYIPLLIVLLIFSAFFSSAETAFLSLQRIRLDHHVKEEDPGAVAVSNLLTRPNRLLSAILVGNNLANTGAAVVGGLIAQRVVSGGLGALLAALVVTVLLVLFGEVGPKTVALHHNYRLTTIYALPMRLWAWLMRPVASILDLVTRAVIKVFGDNRESNAEISEAELRTMIGLSAETGAVEADEAQLIHRVFEFGDRQVHEVMVPRTEVVWLANGTSVEHFYEVFAQTPHSRFPIFDGDADNVTGIVGIKEVMRAVAMDEIDDPDAVDAVAGPAYFVPATKSTLDLFREMQLLGHQMAVAVDEWGGTAGIVTLEALLEEMVGQVGEELQPSKPEITALDEGTVHVNGSLSVEEAREELELDIPEGPYDTIAGFFLSQAGHIPRQGEFIIFETHRIAVIEMRSLKIQLLQITSEPVPPESSP